MSNKEINMSAYTDTYGNLLKLKREKSDRDIYVWGAKITGGAMCSVLLREEFTNVAGVIDSNVVMQGKSLYGLTIISPEEFWSRKEQGKTPFIIVAAAIRAKEIYDICMEHGLEEEIDFCWADDLLGPVYEIDLTNACNLKCPSCPQNNWTRHENCQMTLERFEKIVQHIKTDTPNVAYIPLFCWTEPLLRKDIGDFLEVLKREKILGILSTNFSMELPQLEEVIQKRPEYFRISFSGYTQEFYQKAHRGGNINLVKSNLFKLRYLLDKYSPDTFVEIYYHEYKYSPEEELKKWRILCDELGFTMFNHSATINPIENVIRILKGEDISDIKEVVDSLKFDFRSRRYPDICEYPELCYSFKNMFCVTAKGKVLVCDCVYDEKKALLSENIEEVTYKELMELKSKNEICKECLRYGIPLYNFTLSSNPKERVRKIYQTIISKDRE